MRILLVFALLTLLGPAAWAQKISYDIPKGYKDDISKADYQRLVDAAVAVVAKRYAIEQVKAGSIRLKPGSEMDALNLHNVIGKYVAARGSSTVEAVVQEHLANLFAAVDAQKNLDPSNYESIKQYLSLRIYPAAAVQQRGGAALLVTRCDLPGTYTMLMLDLPGAFAGVQKAMFAAWGQDTATVFRVAQANVNQQRVEKITKPFDIDGSKIELSFLGNEDYAASYLLDLAHNSPELLGEWGAVVAVPNKGLVDICKVGPDKPLDFVKFIQRTRPLVLQAYREHAQPVSDQYFWYYQGRFTRVPVTEGAGGAIQVVAPLGLGTLMTEKK
jgi:hypothetical protein